MQIIIHVLTTLQSLFFKHKAIFLCAGFVILSALFYNASFKKYFRDVESHIPATILAQKHGYDTQGYGLSFVSAPNIQNTYGEGAFEILYNAITTQSFSHYTSTIGLQGFVWAYIYNTFDLHTMKPLYMIDSLFSALMIMLCVYCIGKIFGAGFGVIFFITMCLSWVVRFGSSLYFVFGLWLLPAIIAFSIYIYIRIQKYPLVWHFDMPHHSLYAIHKPARFYHL